MTAFSDDCNGCVSVQSVNQFYHIIISYKARTQCCMFCTNYHELMADQKVNGPSTQQLDRGPIRLVVVFMTVNVEMVHSGAFFSDGLSALVWRAKQ